MTDRPIIFSAPMNWSVCHRCKCRPCQCHRQNIDQMEPTND